MKQYKTIIYINPKNIEPHPNNPRKDLGDLEEMTKSIKLNGVMQNLTVVPIGEYKKDGNDKFTVIIGHRRLAAAKRAGLSEVPCKVVEGMSEKEQLTTMLEENMQRNDLTVYEQAQGFQMMLDLGDTVEDIVEKTGFSQATVYHRINLAKLDQDLLKEKNEDEGFQMSLKDMYLLEQIEDVEKRNEILKKSKDSSDLKWNVKNEVNAIERRKYLEDVKAALDAAGIPRKDISETWKFDYIRGTNTYSRENIEEFVAKVINHNGENKFYNADDYGVRVYADRKPVSVKDESPEDTQPNEPTEEELEEQKREAEIEKLNETCEATFEEIKFFIRSLVAGDINIDSPKETDEITKKLWDHMIEAETCDDYDGMVRCYTGENPYQMDKKEKEEIIEHIKGTPVYMQILLILMDELDLDMIDYDGVYDDDYGKSISRLYEELKELHFSFSKEEYEEVILGTHELYQEREDD